MKNDVRRKNNLLSYWIVAVIFLSFLDISQSSYALTQKDSALTSPFTTSAGNEVVICQGSLLDIFTRARYKSRVEQIILTDPVSLYIKTCYPSKDAAVKMLRDNGFKVTLSGKNSDRTKMLNKHWRVQEQEYEEFIFAKRGTDVWHFFDVFTHYEVTLFIKNNEVKRIYADTTRTMP